VELIKARSKSSSDETHVQFTVAHAAMLFNSLQEKPQIVWSINGKWYLNYTTISTQFSIKIPDSTSRFMTNSESNVSQDTRDLKQLHTFHTTCIQEHTLKLWTKWYYWKRKMCVCVCVCVCVYIYIYIKHMKWKLTVTIT